MLNYKKMTAKEAIRAAKEESGLTAEQVARRLNVSTSVIRRYLKEDDNYFPGLEMLPRLCLVLGNSLLLDWATAQIKQEDDEQREKMLASLTNAINVLEEARFLITKMETLTCWEEEEIHAALDEAEMEGNRVRDILPQKQCDCGKKKRFWCPLWKLWQKCFYRTRSRQK
ncbi:helix-turn-helix domain-containing protein [uncultured Bilophila sp.]|uniref:helix-turn-helix domain-containing protein n=1 Tax=uncultured Bilophila sp. TaxID=529385 RepID=UPI00280B3999|nr:helix-turn-helix domain-containing protein [uncultured Bilophila sp.]